MAKSKWKPLKDYPQYEISEEGFVRNNKNQLMQWHDNGKGYKYVRLRKKNKTKNCLVHRLVMFTFSEQTNYLYTDINHKDGNKSNNHVSNLEWVTKSENIRHAHTNGLMKTKLDAATVKQIKKDLAIKNRLLYRELADKYGVNTSTIGKIATGKMYQYI